MNYEMRLRALAYGLVSTVLCSGLTAAGYIRAVSRQAEEPAVSVPVLAIHAEEPAIKEPAISAADLWSDDRNRIDAPLLSAELAAETQWAIFERCGQDAELFCTVMAIAAVESDFNPQKTGDDGDSIGMMQINTKWHTNRMEALGVTDLTDPVQCAVVAIDYLLELEETMQTGPGDQTLCIAYNCGPNSAKQKIRSGITANTYSEAVTEVYRDYLAEMGSMALNK